MFDRLGLYIDGAWRQGSCGRDEPVVDPATGAVLGSVPHASPADLDAALAAAARAFASWRAVVPWERAKVLRRVADLLRERADAIATVLTREQGKPLPEARAEVQAAADVFEWCAEEGKRTYGRVVPGRRDDIRQMVLHEPVGPVAAFAPWNFPVVLPARKIAAALAAGCSVILKPSEETPASAMALVQACADAGVPPGALNLVFGVPAEVSAHLIASPIIRKVSLTGSIRVGKALARLAAENLVRCTFELGGHAPVLVFDDVDVEAAADALAFAKFRNAGQVCVAPSRFYVHEGVHDRFVERFAAYARALKVGNGAAEGVTMGPLANERQRTSVEAGVADALGRGARLVTGGGRIGNEGFFYAPTVLDGVPDDAALMLEEPFGPVAPVASFRHLDEVVARANALPYGLASYLFTRSLAVADRAARTLDAGMVGINHTAFGLPETPVCGVKASGYGHEGGSEGIGEYLVTKFVNQVAA